jgi:hypothetical protein
MTQVTISLTDEQTKSLFNTEELLLTLTEDDKKQIALELYKEAMKVEVDMAVQRHKSDIWYRTNMNDLITPIIKDLICTIYFHSLHILYCYLIYNTHNIWNMILDVHYLYDSLLYSHKVTLTRIMHI